MNLVSEWTFDEDSAGIAKDTWGNNNGTLYGANGLPQLQTKEDCVQGTCYLFDGMDDYIDCGNNYNYERSNKVTISVWVKSNGDQENGNGGIISNIFGEFNKNRILLKNDNGIYAQFFINGVQSNFISTRIINTRSWNHIVYTYDGYKEKIYINSEFDEKVNSGNIRTGTSSVAIGIGQSSYPFYHFNGLIDGVRIYNAALSTAQIKQEYIAGLNSLLANNSISKEEYDQRLNNLAYDKE